MNSNEDHQSIVNEFLIKISNPNDPQYKQAVQFQSQLFQFQDILQCLLRSFQIPQIRLSSVIYLREYVIKTQHIIEEIVNIGFQCSFQNDIISSFGRTLLSECYIQGSINVKKYIINSLQKALSQQPNIPVLETVYSIIKDDEPTMESLCPKLFKSIIFIFNACQQEDIIETVLKSISECCKYPDFSSDYGQEIVPKLIQLSNINNDNIKLYYCIIISSLVSLVPDCFIQHISIIIQKCFELLLHDNEEIFSNALSIITSLAQSFKNELKQHLRQFLIIILQRLERILPTIDDIFEEKEAVIRNKIELVLDELSGEYKEEFTTLLIEICQNSSWEASVLAVCSIANGLSEKVHFGALFSWVIEKIYDEIHSSQQPRQISLYALWCFYPYLQSILQPMQYQEIIQFMLNKPLDSYSYYFIYAMIHDITNPFIQQYLENVLQWLLQNMNVQQNDQNVLFSIELLYGLTNQFNYCFQNNKEIFTVVFQQFNQLINKHMNIKDTIIINFSFIIKHFGGNAIEGNEMKMLETIIELSKEDNIDSLKASLQLLNSLIETSNNSIQVINSLRDITTIIPIGLNSIDDKFADQCYTLIANILSQNPIVLQKMNSGKIDLRLWVMTIVIPFLPNGIDNFISQLISTLIQIIETFDTQEYTSIQFMRKNLCVCFGLIALQYPQLVCEHMPLICDELIDSLYQVIEDELRINALKGLGRLIENNPSCCKTKLLSVVKVLLFEIKNTPEMANDCKGLLNILQQQYNGENYVSFWEEVQMELTQNE